MILHPIRTARRRAYDQAVRDLAVELRATAAEQHHSPGARHRRSALRQVAQRLEQRVAASSQSPTKEATA